MKRRQALSVGLTAGLGALGLGAGLAWHLSSRDTAPVAQGDAGGVPDLWSQTLRGPNGQPLDLQPLRGRPLVLNFWATWCPPCVREMPELDQFARTQGPGGWQVLGLAIDSADKVREFLGAHPVGFAVAVLGMEGLSLVRAFGNAGGGLPYTVVLNAQGQPLHRKMGPTDAAELQGWATGQGTKG